MKKDIKHFESKTVNRMWWWSWTEICDACGKEIQLVDTWKGSSNPNIHERDFCLNCLRFKVDNKIESNDKLIEAIQAIHKILMD